jgi:hypothetical protein
MNKLAIYFLSLGIVTFGTTFGTITPAHAGSFLYQDQYGNCIGNCDMIHVDSELQTRFQYYDMKWFTQKWIEQNPSNIMVQAHKKGMITYPRLFAHAYREVAKSLATQ